MKLLNILRKCKKNNSVYYKNFLNIERAELEKIMHSKEDLVSDVGSVLIGKEAVECGLINEVGGLKDAMSS